MSKNMRKEYKFSPVEFSFIEKVIRKSCYISDKKEYFYLFRQLRMSKNSKIKLFNKEKNTLLSLLFRYKESEYFTGISGVHYDYVLPEISKKLI